MVTQLNPPPMIFTIKYVDVADSLEKMIDLPALGNSDAQDQFAEKYPNCRLVNIFRKS